MRRWVDFDLLKIHPQMVNHGMGYYERWFRRGYDHRWGDDTGTHGADRQVPSPGTGLRPRWLYRGGPGDNLPWVIREHHLMHPGPATLRHRPADEIRYEVEGRFVTASVALVAGDTSRQRIRYDSGLQLWVNWRDEPWQVEGRVLPQWGFLALGPDTEVSTTMREGQVGRLRRMPGIHLRRRPHLAFPCRISKHRRTSNRGCASSSTSAGTVSR